MKKCRICKQEYEPFNSLQKVCSPKCAITLVNNEKLIARKKDTRRRKEALKTKSDYIKEAQTAFNAYIRERDKHEVCISCGGNAGNYIFTGGNFDCGHYRSIGSCIHLRFHPMNAHKQCKQCNRDKSGNHVNYRIRLKDKIGENNLDWLEGPHEAQHWSIEDIKEIKQWYKQQLKNLKQGEI